ncbi:UDP-N-acetylmuramyl-tripeptide synthetase [Philodulcilactobacillus myokoensis]|uniref:UDP-N-acetylmuramyl-tripeptide synthetase n=1 Tax=Philodulcilactobacillus myokoensis TaxID=2929573 RepID=A0A9W6B143_9LACO|nr:UDP-N-acetylmuramoyl-L-alanyl-D-glutamate--2,6-diaminopimelate ligase [Philodulcilactobacillus myokoensis]GLB46728.1 UDP-N-acetylmuramyl-tripeptide synthetase [Philodulcilactobacillus myokoensis]
MLTVNEIITLLNEHHLLKSYHLNNNQKVFKHVTYDSRKATDQTLFFCKGNFKPQYLTSAIEKGASGYVSEKHFLNQFNGSEFIVSDVQKAMALLGAAFYGYPQNQMHVIGITGTKGKTTTGYFIRSILQNTTNRKTALFSTIDTFLGNQPNQRFKSQLTTPESLDLFKNMRTAVDNGMTNLVMEVSSQSYKKNRVYGMHYDVGIFLNITPDHIGPNEHPNFADYLHCKEQLLVNSKVCLINAESKHLKDLYFAAKTTSEPSNIYFFARQGTKPEYPVRVDFQFKSLKDNMNANQIHFVSSSDRIPKLKSINGNYKLSMPGDYNESNATAAIVAAGFAGANSQDIYNGLSNVNVPGRMERHFSKSHGTIYVDYAHNYASMHALLGFLKRENQDSNIIVVLGSTGDKGENRRKGFGKALSEYADVAFLTTDDPGDENPMAIDQQIDSYVDHNKVKVNFELDRTKAIQKAITMSNNHDMVVVAGKGRDPYQKVNGKNIPYETDSVAVDNVLKGLEK